MDNSDGSVFHLSADRTGLEPVPSPRDRDRAEFYFLVFISRS